MKNVLLLVALMMVVGAQGAVSFDVASPDDIMLRRPRRKAAPVVMTVTQTNWVTQTDYVTKTNYVTATQTDYVTKTNVVTHTDYVTKTNVVVQTVVDDRMQRELEAARKALMESEAARKAAEDKVGTIARQALDERTAREKADAMRRAAERRAETERSAALAARAEAAEAKAVNVEHAAVKQVAAEKQAAEVEKKRKLTGRESVITAERTDYDRKEGIILFDRNVYVDDEQYQMHADRVFVFLEGTNELKRLVAIGHVAITNEDKTAYCARATYAKKTGKIVMYSNDEIKARLKENTKKGGTVVGERITFWVDSEQVEVENSAISMPGGAFKGGDARKFLGK